MVVFLRLLFGGVWIAYRQRTWLRRVSRFLLLMTLGNIAIASYLLIALFRLAPGQELRELVAGRGPA